MTSAAAFLEFRQGGPFYDMVASFMVALAGSPSIFNPGNPMKLDQGHYITIHGILTPGRHIRPLELYDQAAKGNISQDQFLRSCCTMLANTAYESVKHKNDRSPEFEFFRHIRNASSHQNRFFLYPHEPVRPAAWRSVRLDHVVKGKANPLHGTDCFGRFIGIADIIDLLGDIERKIPI